MINVMHVRSSTGFYGAEKVIYNIFHGFNEDDITLSLITLETADDASKTLRKRLESKNDVIGYELSKKYDASTISKIKEQLVNDKVHIVHTHDYKSLFYVISATSSLNVKIIHHMHGFLNNTISERIYSLLERYLLRYTVAVIVVSKLLKKQLKNTYLTKDLDVFYLSNGTLVPDISDKLFKEDAEAEPEPEPIKISLIARFTEEKNHTLALDVAEFLTKKNIKFSMNFYGEGPLLNKISKLVKQKKLEHCVHIFGYCDDVSQIYAVTDILLITSLTEGLPMVLLEAMSYSIPVISTNVGQISDVLDHERCGFLTEFEVEDISQKLHLLITERRQRSAMGMLARKRVVNSYSISYQVAELCKKYREYK